jgi:hypothetical protein
MLSDVKDVHCTCTLTSKDICVVVQQTKLQQKHMLLLGSLHTLYLRYVTVSSFWLKNNNAKYPITIKLITQFLNEKQYFNLQIKQYKFLFRGHVCIVISGIPKSMTDNIN